jgi:hypothetical protein
VGIFGVGRTFISSCGFGFMRTSAPINSRVPLSVFGLRAMSEEHDYARVGSDHLRAIGAIIVNFSAIEWTMDLAILSFYGIPLDRGLVFTSTFSFQNRLSLLRIFAGAGAIPSKQDTSELSALLNKIESAYGKRNEIAHGFWNPTNHEKIIRRMAIKSKGRKLRCLDEKVTLRELEDCARNLTAICGAFTVLTRRLGAALGYSPETGGKAQMKQNLAD